MSGAGGWKRPGRDYILAIQRQQRAMVCWNWALGRLEGSSPCWALAKAADKSTQAAGRGKRRATSPLLDAEEVELQLTAA